jgi:hypothetical protein
MRRRLRKPHEGGFVDPDATKWGRRRRRDSSRSPRRCAGCAGWPRRRCLRTGLPWLPMATGGGAGRGTPPPPRGEVGDDTGTGVRRDPLGGAGPHSQEGARRRRGRAAAPAAVHPGFTPPTTWSSAGTTSAAPHFRIHQAFQYFILFVSMSNLTIEIAHRHVEHHIPACLK